MYIIIKVYVFMYNSNMFIVKREYLSFLMITFNVCVCVCVCV